MKIFTFILLFTFYSSIFSLFLKPRNKIRKIQEKKHSFIQIKNKEKVNDNSAEEEEYDDYNSTNENKNNSNLEKIKEDIDEEETEELEEKLGAEVEKYNNMSKKPDEEKKPEENFEPIQSEREYNEDDGMI